jgi:hypothetical protein
MLSGELRVDLFSGTLENVVVQHKKQESNFSLQPVMELK